MDKANVFVVADVQARAKIIFNVALDFHHVVVEQLFVQFNKDNQKIFRVPKRRVLYLQGIAFVLFKNRLVKKFFNGLCVKVVVGNHVAYLLHQVYRVDFPRHRKKGKAFFVAIVNQLFWNFLYVFSGVYYKASRAVLDELVDKLLEVVENVFARFYSVVVFGALVVYAKSDG